MRNSILLCLVLAGGCTASGSARYSAEATTPRLVYVTDDVQVIEDYHEPVFFSASMYWRYDGGVWYQSRYHTRGWVRVSTPPPQIVRIDRPQAYIRFRGTAQADGPSPAMQREMKEEKREQKEAAREERQEDKREMKEEKREMKEEKQEAKQEAKQEKQEAKQEAKEAKQDAKDDHKNKKNKK
ncbi:MAG: hypothetical protein M4D80_33720 [Myxococcota bacterium]|nr:hypothetical protein [Myxococcota bacterium]